MNLSNNAMEISDEESDVVFYRIIYPVHDDEEGGEGGDDVFEGGVAFDRIIYPVHDDEEGGEGEDDVFVNQREEGEEEGDDEADESEDGDDEADESEDEDDEDYDEIDRMVAIIPLHKHLPVMLKYNLYHYSTHTAAIHELYCMSMMSLPEVTGFLNELKSIQLRDLRNHIVRDASVKYTKMEMRAAIVAELLPLIHANQ
jgi:hypothetical protein